MIDFLLSIVKVHTGSRGRCHAQSFHQRLCTMMTRPDCNSVFVQKRGHVVGMNVSQIEAYDSSPRVWICGSVDLHSPNSSKSFQRVRSQLSFMVSDAPKPDS